MASAPETPHSVRLQSRRAAISDIPAKANIGGTHTSPPNTCGSQKCQGDRLGRCHASPVRGYPRNWARRRARSISSCMDSPADVTNRAVPLGGIRVTISPILKQYIDIYAGLWIGWTLQRGCKSSDLGVRNEPYRERKFRLPRSGWPPASAKPGIAPSEMISDSAVPDAAAARLGILMPVESIRKPIGFRTQAHPARSGAPVALFYRR